MQKLEDRIAATFPLVTVSADDVSGIPPESFCYQRDFGGNDWGSVSEEIYESHTDAFILMSPTTLRHFIAGFLSVACSTTNSLSAESLIYAATHGDHLSQLCASLSLRQVECLFDVAEHVYLDNCGDDDDDEFLLIRRNRLSVSALRGKRG